MTFNSTSTKILSVCLLIVCVATGAAIAEPANLSASGPESGTAGETVTITFTLENTGENAGSYIVDVSLPENWEVVERSDDGGTWKQSENKWLWQTIEAGATAEPSVTVQIPEDTSGTHTIEASIKDIDGVRDTTSLTLNVETSTETPTETPTVTPTETDTQTEGTPTNNDKTPQEEGGDSSGLSDAIGPGFGSIVGILGVILAVYLLTYTRS